MRPTTLSTLLTAGLLLFSGLVFAQTRVTVDLNRATPKYQLHFTQSSKVIETKKDVSSISYSGGWFFVIYKSNYDYSGAPTTADVYSADGTVKYTNQDRDFWHGFYVDHDRSIVDDGLIVNVRKNELLGQLTNYEEHSHIVDGVVLVRRDTLYENSHCKVYDFLTETGQPLRQAPLYISYYSHDLKDPSPLIDGRRAFYINDTREWVYLDGDGNMAFNARFTGAHDFSEGLAAVQKEVDGEYKWGFINTEGEEVIPFRFSKEPGDFHDGYAVVTKLNRKMTFVMKNGSTVDMEEDELFPRWNDHVVMCDLNPTFTYFMTPTKVVVYPDLNSTRWDYDTVCPIPFITGGYGSPVISYDGELLYKRKPGMYMADGFWWDNHTSGYSAVVFNTQGEVLLAFKTVQDEF